MKEFNLTFHCDNLFDIIYAVIKYGPKTQEGLAGTLDMTKETFSRKFNNPGDTFYSQLDHFRLLLKVTDQIAPLQFLAGELGYKLVKIEEPENNKRLISGGGVDGKPSRPHLPE
jgi:hypothetical protein